VKKLIAGPKVQICDECVDICLNILSEDRKDDPAEPQTPESNRVWCGLCHMSTPANEMLAIPERGLVCRPCVAAVQEAVSR